MTTNPAFGYTLWRRGPNSAVDVPPKVFVVSLSRVPPNCHMHEPVDVPVE